MRKKRPPRRRDLRNNNTGLRFGSLRSVSSRDSSSSTKNRKESNDHFGRRRSAPPPTRPSTRRHKIFLRAPNQISTPSSSHCCIMLVSVYVSCGEKWDRSVVSGVLVSGRCALFLSSSSARPSSPYPSSLANRPLTRTRLSALSLRIWYRMFFLNDRLAFFLLYRSTACFLRSASPRRPCKTSSGDAHEE